MAWLLRRLGHVVIGATNITTNAARIVARTVNVVVGPLVNAVLPATQPRILAAAMAKQTVSVEQLALAAKLAYNMNPAELAKSLPGFKLLATKSVGFSIKAYLLQAPSGQLLVAVRGTHAWENYVANTLTVAKEILAVGPTLTGRLRAQVAQWEAQCGERVSCMVGHSIGGYYATHAFNSVERPDMVRVAMNSPFVPNDANVLALRNAGDMVSALCQHVGAPVITLPATSSSMIKNHSINSILKQIQAKGQDVCKSWTERILSNLSTCVVPVFQDTVLPLLNGQIPHTLLPVPLANLQMAAAILKPL